MSSKTESKRPGLGRRPFRSGLNSREAGTPSRVDSEAERIAACPRGAAAAKPCAIGRIRQGRDANVFDESLWIMALPPVDYPDRSLRFCWSSSRSISPRA